jgi:hypothetical protein
MMPASGRCPFKEKANALGVEDLNLGGWVSFLTTSVIWTLFVWLFIEVS